MDIGLDELKTSRIREIVKTIVLTQDLPFYKMTGGPLWYNPHSIRSKNWEKYSKILVAFY